MYRYIKSAHSDRDYFGQTMYEKYHELVESELSGMVISKSSKDDGNPGSVEYESRRLGIDIYDLIQCLEGMCHNGTAREISDYQYEVLV